MVADALVLSCSCCLHAKLGIYILLCCCKWVYMKVFSSTISPGLCWIKWPLNLLHTAVLSCTAACCLIMCLTIVAHANDANTLHSVHVCSRRFVF